MVTIKSYTDLEQSKRLANILALESADMYYTSSLIKGHTNYFPHLKRKFPIDWDIEQAIPCWSLAALLNTLRTFTTSTAFSVKVSAPSLIKTESGYKLIYTGDYTPMINNGSDVEAPIESIAENAVDACVNMIEKLHELNLL